MGPASLPQAPAEPSLTRITRNRCHSGPGSGEERLFLFFDTCCLRTWEGLRNGSSQFSWRNLGGTEERLVARPGVKAFPQIGKLPQVNHLLWLMVMSPSFCHPRTLGVTESGAALRKPVKNSIPGPPKSP